MLEGGLQDGVHEEDAEDEKGAVRHQGLEVAPVSGTLREGVHNAGVSHLVKHLDHATGTLR